MDLRAFIDLLEREGELTRVSAEVDPYLEMAEIADRASKAHGPALLFARPQRPAGVAGPAASVLMNQLGSYRRLELALGAPLDELAARIAGLVELQVPRSLIGKVKALGQLRELASYGPRIVKKAAFREVIVEPPDLTRLPVLTTWPGDGGPFITLPIVVTKDAQGRRNAGMYRLQVFDAQTTGMHIHIHHDGAANFREAGDRMEVAVALGTDPAVTYAATAPLPPGIDEFMFAGFLRGAAGRAGRSARPSTWKCPPTPRSSSKATSSRASCAAKARSATTRATTPWPTSTRSFTSRRSRTAAIPSTRPPSSAARPWRTPTSARPPSASSCPCCRLVQPEIVDMDLPIEGVFHDCAIIVDPQDVPRPGAQDHERRLGHGADDVHQVRRRGRRARRRARLQRGHVARVQQRRPAPRHGLIVAARSTCSTTPARWRATVPRWASTPPRRGPRKVTAASGPTSSTGRGRRAARHGPLARVRSPLLVILSASRTRASSGLVATRWGNGRIRANEGRPSPGVWPASPTWGGVCGSISS